MINNLFIFLIALFVVIKGATMATKYAANLAEGFKLSKYIVGFIVVAIISVLPETFIALDATVRGMPSFGLGMLFGANVADLTLVFAAIVFLSGRSVKVESKILTNHAVYPFMLLLPLVLGLNGHFSRVEGLALIIIGGIFYYVILKKSQINTVIIQKDTQRKKNIIMLLFSMAVLLIGAHFTVTSASEIANYLGVSPILVGMFIVGLGTTMPEFFFALNAVKKRDDSLAVGDILGTVLANATIVVGIMALLSPFSFSQSIIYVTGVFMVTASFILFYFMKTGRTLTKKEANLLFIFWLVFALVEFIVNR